MLYYVLINNDYIVYFLAKYRVF